MPRDLTGAGNVTALRTLKSTHDQESARGDCAAMFCATRNCSFWKSRHEITWSCLIVLAFQSPQKPSVDNCVLLYLCPLPQKDVKKNVWWEGSVKRILSNLVGDGGSENRHIINPSSMIVHLIRIGVRSGDSGGSTATCRCGNLVIRPDLTKQPNRGIVED